MNAFYNDYSEYIYADPTGTQADDLPVFAYRQGAVHFYGFEAEMTAPLAQSNEHHLELRLASDYVRARLEHGGNLPQIPPLRFGVGLHYERGLWHLGAEAFRYQAQKHTAAHELRTDGYTALEIDASYRWRDVFLFLRGSNLLDEEARQHASSLKDIAPLPGRSLHAGLRAQF